MDTAHFVLPPFLGYLYSLAVRFIKSWSGRKRFSVPGAINAVSKEPVMMTATTYVDSMTVCALRKELACRYYDRHVVVVLDNARYRRCRPVLRTAERLHIRPVFLPPYSPNLNLIARLWKFVKKKVLDNQFYFDFHLFCSAITRCFGRTDSEYRNMPELC